LAFVFAIAAGTGLLMLPVSRVGDGSAPFMTALFTATSAVTTSGMTTVDTATYWSGVGHVSHRLGIRGRMMAGVETSSGLAHGDVR
jgi:trk system potassium uptake protein